MPEYLHHINFNLFFGILMPLLHTMRYKNHQLLSARIFARPHILQPPSFPVVLLSFIGLSTRPSIHSSIHSFIHPFIHPFIHLSIHSFSHHSIHLYIHHFIHLYNTIQYKLEYYYSGINPVEFRGHIYISIHPSIHTSITPSINPSINQTIYSTIHQSIHQSIHQYIH